MVRVCILGSACIVHTGHASREVLQCVEPVYTSAPKDAHRVAKCLPTNKIASRMHFWHRMGSMHTSVAEDVPSACTHFGMYTNAS